jgi:MFS family permease
LMGLGLCRNYYAALGCMALAGFGLVTQLSTGNSLLQLNVPDELRGRLMSLFGLIVMGFAPVGSILYGVAAHYAGAGPSITGGAVIAALVAGVVLWKNPDLRHFGFSEPEPPDPGPIPPAITPFSG